MFEVKAKSVGKPVAPQIDDKFAKGFGVDSLGGLKDGVRAQIQREYDQVSRNKLKRELLDAPRQGARVRAAANACRQRVRGHLEAAHRQLAAGRQDLRRRGQVRGAVQEEYRKIAERRVRLGLVIGEIGTQGKIEVTQEELRNALFKQARRFPGQERMVYEYFEKNAGRAGGAQGAYFRGQGR